MGVNNMDVDISGTEFTVFPMKCRDYLVDTNREVELFVVAVTER